jgi:hypothetical protein
MRRILAIALLALTAVTGLPATAHAGGPTSVLVTQPGAAAAGLYYSDEAYGELLRLLPADETRGEAEPPSGGVDYNLTWMIHDVSAWRYDRVTVAGDGTAWVSTTFTSDAVGGWEPAGAGTELFDLLSAVLDDSAAPAVVTVPAAETPGSTPLAAPQEPRTTWFSLAGWRWLVPGGLLGVLVGAAAARRRGADEPRRMLVEA